MRTDLATTQLSHTQPHVTAHNASDTLQAKKVTHAHAKAETSLPNLSKPDGKAISLLELTQSRFPEREFKAIPKQVHMIWVASLPKDVQVKYVKDWAQKNPSASINLWVDSRHFETYGKNKTANTAARIDVANLSVENQLRNLTQQLAVSRNDKAALNLSIAELNKSLKGDCKTFKQAVLGKDDKVSTLNCEKVLKNLNSVLAKNEEKFLEADAKLLSHTVQSWDHYKSGLNSDTASLANLRQELQKLGLNNIHVKDLSNKSDITLKNEDAYQHEMIGRGGAYPAASDIARYEILSQHGGIYTDVDLECKQTLDFDQIKSHPNLILVGMAATKKEEAGNATPYFANALIASHKDSDMINELIKDIGTEYNSLKGNDFLGTRYFARANKATIERTGPNKLREQVAKELKQPRNDIDSKSQRIWDKAQQVNSDIWKAIDSHFTFPEGLIEFETPEQADSATKAMAEPAANVASTINLERLTALLEEKIADKSQPGKPDIVFLSGPSASGKSTVSEALQQRQGKLVTVKTDHFLKSFSDLSQHPANKGKPVAQWQVVHGHPESYDQKSLERLLKAISQGEEFTYTIPSQFKENVRLESDPYPRGERDPNGAQKKVNVPKGDTYIIEGIIVPHLIKDNQHPVVQLDVDYHESMERRVQRDVSKKIENPVPESVRQQEDKAQFDAVVNGHKSMEERGAIADIKLDSTGQTQGHFTLC
ncbi:TcdA/TcdB catalytic glycosyltransferase domain-containing protein [Vibrio ostreicida]|uniref:TcdA/TcdB catalytic glycosyltransferase domain-containing protein n=1 Tax=Vibrio ostreicida TaxID=526588 RepID=A0ABT8BYS6_9VIBR|nr:TcdA/TcdB catalytic glycosyltransferase domain-containing protein [Vibrio ostreicida]MDN3612315.1 TcdA/TcdB catalytic glycosyltransferase domain-containing protein [Vibrio ostreicida]NPD08697.1 AAA family ATPase [Vibrio ostreicida]